MRETAKGRRSIAFCGSISSTAWLEDTCSGDTWRIVGPPCGTGADCMVLQSCLLVHVEPYFASSGRRDGSVLRSVRKTGRGRDRRDTGRGHLEVRGASVRARFST
jgi:hypothetical protein